MQRNGPVDDQEEEKTADEEEGNVDESIAEHERKRFVKSIGRFPFESRSFLEEGRNSRDGHEAEESL